MCYLKTSSAEYVYALSDNFNNSNEIRTKVNLFSAIFKSWHNSSV